MLIEAIRNMGDEKASYGKIYGQEKNLLTSAIARMNLFLHGAKEFKIVREDTLRNPVYIHNGQLQQFDCVLANPPFDLNHWGAEIFENDQWGRNIWGKEIIGYPITRIETISERTVDRSKMGYAGIVDLNKYSSYVLQDGDILMSHINSITHMGKSALYRKKPDENIIHGMNLLCLRPVLDIVHPLYLYMYFQTDYFYEQVISITRPAVNQASMDANGRLG